MNTTTSAIAIIPARGGSKGIPNKNLINFAGKPLIVWTIEQIIRCKSVADVYVSSDCEEILATAKAAGAKTIKRPSIIAKDTSTSEESLSHFLDTLDVSPTAVVFLQATSPLREPKDIDNAMNLFIEKELDSLFSAVSSEDMCLWAVNNEVCESLNYDYKNRKRRQDIHGQVIENGSFYIFKPSIMKKYNNRLGGRIGFYLMDKWKIHEIDDLEDLEMCKYIFINKGLG